MSSRGLASLLAIPPALRPVLLQALALTAAPPSALRSPAICTPAQCRWKYTTSRTPIKKKKKSGPPSGSGKKKSAPPSASSKKAGPGGSAASKKRAAPSGPPKGKNPNGYPKGAKKASTAGSQRGSKGKNPNGFPAREPRPARAARTAFREALRADPNGSRSETSYSRPSRTPKGKNMDRKSARSEFKEAAPATTGRGRNTDSHGSRTQSPRAATRADWDETFHSQTVREALSPVSVTNTEPASPQLDTALEVPRKKTRFPRPNKTRDLLNGSAMPTTLSFLPPPPTLPIAATPAPSPAQLDFIRTATIFREPKFLYSAPRFLNLPVNTRMPEICLLGRSNVGKSTLINALGGLGSKKAGTAHVTSHKKLAITSATAGCTKTMNAYGFGPPGSVKPLTRKEQEARKGAGRSRTEKRAGQTKVLPEALPKHTMVLMDMPGYGQNSRADWGAEILKYLNRREILTGAVLLIDAVAGVKDGDRGVLEVLRDAGLTTSVVLTKADKLLTSADPAAWRECPAIRQACEHVWAEMRRVERAGELSSWWEGEGWTPEVFVTGAGDPRTGGMGVEGARVAIARLAGLVEAPVVEVPDAPEVVPYDQLVFAVPSGMPAFKVQQKSEEEVIREQREARASRTPVVGRGRTRTRLRVVAPKPVDPLQVMQESIHRPARRGQLGKASF